MCVANAVSNTQHQIKGINLLSQTYVGQERISLTCTHIIQYIQIENDWMIATLDTDREIDHWSICLLMLLVLV